MAMASEDSENEYTEQRRKLVQAEIQNIREVLKDIDTNKLNINIKITSGKRGFEISKFARKVEANLVVVAGAGKKLGFMDRILSHDLEYLLADIPTNLLIIHN